MSGAHATIRRLFYAAFLFGLACGVSLALTPLLLAESFDKSWLGGLAVSNALGIVAMAIPAGLLCKRVSPTAALVGFLTLYAVFDAALPFVHGAAAISVVRFFDGACSVGVWISSESLLLTQTHESDKANLTSQYAIWLSSGYVAGGVVANVMQKFSTRSNAYVLSGIISLVAAVYVAISVGAASRRTRAAIAEAEEKAVIPEVSDSEKAAALVVDHANEAPPLPTWELLRRIRCSCYSAFVYGYFQAAVVLFLPSFLVESKGIASERTTLLPGIFCFGMLLASNLVGRIADKRGHLVVMRVCAAIGTVFVFGFVALSDWRLMYVAVFCAGGTLAAMSPVSLALQGVATPTRDYARGNSLYNLWYASGILLGPPISGALFEHFGGGVMLTHLALLWASFVVFSTIFRADDPAYLRHKIAAVSAAA